MHPDFKPFLFMNIRDSGPLSGLNQPLVEDDNCSITAADGDLLNQIKRRCVCNNAY